MKTFILTICLILVASVVFAGVTITGTELTVEYTEPTANEAYCEHPTNYQGLDTQLLCEANSGTWRVDKPLSDLSLTRIYYNVKDDTGRNSLDSVDVPATSPNGGGAITKKIVVPIWSPELSIDVSLSAVDTSNNESDRSDIISVTLDVLPPKAPVMQ